MEIVTSPWKNPRTLNSLAEAEDELNRVLREGLSAKGAEEALEYVTGCVVERLGDKKAHLKPGALKEGEHQYAVAGVFMISPDRRHNVLLASQNFPPEQHHIHIDINFGHPGETVRTQKPRLLANTDEHPDYKQILKTSRMGSSYYAPLKWKGEMLGQLISGAQARHTYRPVDLEILCAFADVAAALWVTHKGPAKLDAIVTGTVGAEA